MCARGAGISTQSSGPRSCALRICAALYASVACVCSTPLGAPLDPEVNRIAASRLASVHGSAIGVAGRQRVEVVDDERGPRPRRARRATSVGAHLMVHGRRDRAEPPARAVQHRDLVAVRRLPRDRVARPDAPRPQPARDARDPLGERRGAATRVSSASSDGRSHGPPGRRYCVARAGGERRRDHVPRPASSSAATSSRRWPASRPSARSCRRSCAGSRRCPRRCTARGCRGTRARPGTRGEKP